MITTKFLITITHKTPIADLADKIAARAYVLDGVENAEAVAVTQDAAKLDALICGMQADMVTYLSPDSGVGQDWFVNRMIWHLDGPEQRDAQGIS